MRFHISIGRDPQRKLIFENTFQQVSTEPHLSIQNEINSLLFKAILLFTIQVMASHVTFASRLSSIIIFKFVNVLHKTWKSFRRLFFPWNYMTFALSTSCLVIGWFTVGASYQYTWIVTRHRSIPCSSETGFSCITVCIRFACWCFVLKWYIHVYWFCTHCHYNLVEGNKSFVSNSIISLHHLFSLLLSNNYLNE